MNRRIIFINLHGNGFMLRTLIHILFKVSYIGKHSHVLEYMLRNGYEIGVYVTPNSNILFQPQWGVLSHVESCLRFLEYRYTMHYNGIKGIKLIKSAKEIRSDDIVVAYIHGKGSVEDMREILGYKALGAIHYHGTDEETDMINEFAPDVMFSEADLRKYSLQFQKRSSDYNGNYLLLPFAYQKRFDNKKPFSERKDKAVAMGTITVCDDATFVETYGTNSYQPLRQQIYDNRISLGDIIDCYISPYKEKKKQEISTKDGFVTRLRKKYHNRCLGQQKKYYSFDMVEKYNEYKICIVPEDANHMMGVGFVEGMACGCAYIGLNYGGYEDLGLVEGKHFIGYDGTLLDLRVKIEHWLAAERSEELATIARAGYDFVRDNFSEEHVAKLFVNKLQQLAYEADKAAGGRRG